jgi:hypothetical protein
MECYIQVAFDGRSRGIWAVGDGSAKRLGVPNPESARNAYIEPMPGETELAALERVLPMWFRDSMLLGPDQLYKVTLAPGQYYPRIARPSGDNLQDSPGIYPGDREALNEMAIAHDQIMVLASRLEDICRTVHPIGPNFTAYGHEIRNLLILACTEAEAFWRGVLVANHVSSPGGRFSTNDYVKLVPAMKLGEYGVYFSSYPWMDIVKPYATWGSSGAPTRDLPWYDAYNSVKHDREGQFHRATLIHAFQAVAGCLVMLFAQYGLNQRQSLRAKGLHLMNVVEVPRWSPSDSYLLPYRHDGALPVPWPRTKIDYPF